MNRVPTVGVIAAPRYPARVRNSDYAQGVALLRLGEFSRTPVQMTSLPLLAGWAGVLGPNVAARVLKRVAHWTGIQTAENLAQLWPHFAPVPPGAFGGADAVMGHGLFPVRMPGTRALPPILWGPGLFPDDMTAAAGISAESRRREIEFKRALAPSAAGVFLTSRLSVDLWNEKIGEPQPERVFVLPIFLPALPRSTDAAELRPSRDTTAFNVLFVGREARRKNLARLIDACRLLQSRSSTPVILTIVSDFRDGPVDVSAPFIRSLGPRPNAEVLALLRSSDVMCVPSIVETFGIVYVEAMARGCAVLAPDRQVQRSLFEDAVAYANPTRPAAIADELERLMDPAVRESLVQRGSELYRLRYAPDMVATSMIDAALSLA